MPLHLLDLPTELLEHILVTLCHINAQSIPACRQTCHTLNTTIIESKLVHYLERLALLGLYDPVLFTGGDASSSSATFTSPSLDLPDRVAALRAWEESWNNLMNGGSGGGDYDDALGVFWQNRKPDLRIALPPPPLSWPNSPRVKYILANILDPDPGLEYQSALDTFSYFDVEDHFSFGPWFVSATRRVHDGLDVRGSYSYLDLHGCLGDAGGGGGGLQGGDASAGADYDRVFWTVIKIPLWNIVEFGLSTELDLAMIINISKIETYEEQEQEEGGSKVATTVTHLALRPLRFRDGTPHPCAQVPVMRLCVKGATVFNWKHAQVLGDYLLLWIGPGDYSLSKLYLVAWKTGSITLLREFHPGMYGAVPAMISKDVLALVQLDPPGIELCRISNMGKEVEDEAGGGEEGSGNNGDRDSDATIDNSRGRSGRSDERPRMDKLCTLLLPPLRQERDGTGDRLHARARVVWSFCVGEHPGHQTFSRGPWPEYRRSTLGRHHHMFRQSTEDSIFSVVMQIQGSEGYSRTFEFAVRCATLLAYADAARHVAPTVFAADAESSKGARDGGSQGQVVVGDVNAKVGVPWVAWGPRATALLDQSRVGWRYLLGERRTTIDLGVDRIRIRDYNPYRIGQAKASMVAKGLGRHEWGDSHEHEGEDLSDEGEGSVDPFHAHSTRRITESSTTPAGEWFEQDVRTALPHLDVEVDIPGCKAIYMEEDQVLVQVDDLDKIAGRTNEPDGRDVGGFALYSM